MDVSELTTRTNDHWPRDSNAVLLHKTWRASFKVGMVGSLDASLTSEVDYLEE